MLRVEWLGLFALGAIGCDIAHLSYLSDGEPGGSTIAEVEAVSPLDAGVRPAEADAGSSESDDAGQGDAGQNEQQGDAGPFNSASEPADAGPTQPVNLLPSGAFETGLDGWDGTGNSTVTSSDVAHSGSHCLRSTLRTWNWEGPYHDLSSLVEPMHAYRMSAWVRTGVIPQPMRLTIKQQCPGQAAEYVQLAAEVGFPGTWTQLSGSWLSPLCDGSEVSVYLEGPPTGVDFLVDDVEIFLLDS